MYTSAHNAKIKVAAITILPASCNPQRQAVTDLVNNWIMKTAINIDYRINAYPIIEDPARPGSMKKVYDSGDSVHLNTVGYNVLGDLIYSSIFNPSLVEVNSAMPDGFVLEQNYPNPFNPATTIRYQIPLAGFVSIKVYDLLGREVAILVNEQKSSGSYIIQFNGSMLPSGLYICELQSGSYKLSRKLLLMK